MSDPASPASPDVSEEEEGLQELQFARCNTTPEETVVTVTHDIPEPSKKKPADSPGDPAAKGPAANKGPSPWSNVNWIASGVPAAVVGLVMLLVGWGFYRGSILPRLTSVAPSPAPVVASTSGGEEPSKAAEQILALQKQVDVMRREQLLMQQNTREALERLSGQVGSASSQPAPAPVSSAADKPGVSRLADMRPDVSPTQQEFIQLKERNRLTQYADEAIATGLRKPLEVLVEYLRDPDSAHLHDAAQAEYLRAVRAIQLLQREDPGYRLPVAELFKGQDIRDEADVKPEELLKLLADQKQPWEVRVRVCFLLLGSPLPETNAKLIQAIKEDPSLEVAKHAQLALEQRIKRRFRIFDIPAIEEWAESQKK